MIAGKWQDIAAQFDDRLKASLTADGLKQAWDQVVAQFGAYKWRAATVKVIVTSTLFPFDTPMTFGSTAMKSRVSFDSDGKIAGIFILKADAP